MGIMSPLRESNVDFRRSPELVVKAKDELLVRGVYVQANRIVVADHITDEIRFAVCKSGLPTDVCPEAAQVQADAQLTGHGEIV